MDENKKIVIDLSQTDTKAFDNPIQTSAKENFKKLMVSFLRTIENTENIDENCKIDRVHNTILINGKRGMGKTSFILSVQKDKELEEQFKKICSFCIIDPTLIETKEHVLLNIITLIKEKVDNYLREYECKKNHISDYQNWNESLKKLAGGLSMLDGVGKNHLQEDMWDSPELILENGLSNSKQGYSLEKNFHKFIDISLKILDKKAFFLILDDIDTSLDKGRDILEVLRKYLTSRKLIIAMLGDIDLYSILVRQLQWEKMDPNKILKDYGDKNIYLGQIEHLEEQYLTKVLKPENRINLKNLLELKKHLYIQDLNGHEEEFEEYIKKMISKVFLVSNNINYRKHYESALLKQSIRSILQVLVGWEKAKNNNNEEFVETIRQTFFTTIKKKFEIYNFINMPSENILNLLSIYVLKENMSRDNHLKLIPEFMNEDDNIAMFYMNTLINYRLKPKEYLSYFIKVGYVFEQFLNIDRKADNELKYFTDHVALDSGESSSKIAKRLLSTSNIHTNTHQAPILLGSVFINQNNLKLMDKTNKNLSLILSRVNGSNFGQYNFLSFFNLLGFMADITPDVENNKEVFINNQQILEFVLYKDKNIGGEIDSDEANYEIENELLGLLNNWSKNVDNIQKLPLFVLAKIWVRTLYTFSNISKNKFENYHEVLDLFIAGFLNALYVEITLFNKENSDILLTNIGFMKNPVKDSEFYYTKVASYKASTMYTLYDYVSTCPLFERENNKLKYFSSLEKITFKINFMDLKENEQFDILEDIIKKTKISKNDLKSYSSLTDRQKDNFIQNKFRNKTMDYFNIPKKKFEELLAELIK